MSASLFYELEKWKITGMVAINIVKAFDRCCDVGIKILYDCTQVVQEWDTTKCSENYKLPLK